MAAERTESHCQFIRIPCPDNPCNNLNRQIRMQYKKENTITWIYIPERIHHVSPYCWLNLVLWHTHSSCIWLYMIFLCTSVIRTVIDVIERLIAVKYKITNSNFILKIILWKRSVLLNLFLFSMLFVIASFIVTTFYKVPKYLNILATYIPCSPSFTKENIQEVEKVFYFNVLWAQKCATSKCIYLILLPSIYFISKSQRK